MQLNLTEAQVLELLNWEEVYEAVKVALMSVSDGRAIQPARLTTSNLNKEDSFLMTMPACVKDEKFGSLVCKLLTWSADNVKLTPPLPTALASITLFDSFTGALKAIISGTEITKWRTAAASVVATKYLTKDKKLQVLSILGAGTQGKIHAIAFQHFFNFHEIRIWNRTADSGKCLVETMNNTVNNGLFKWFDSNEECIRGADVIITTTTPDKPIIELEWIKRGAHINAVGYNPNGSSELSNSIYLNADVYIDHWAGAKVELAHLEKIGVIFKGEIGEVIYERAGSDNSGKITVFQSLGMAVEDCTVARLVYDKYMANNQN